MIHLEDLEFSPYYFKSPTEPHQLLSIAYTSPKKDLLHGVWESEPGKLDLNFTWTETIYVLEGSAQVKNIRTAEEFTLRPGVLMTFEKGTHWNWQILSRLRKVFTILT